MNDAYKKQVQLLLDVLPEVAKEKCFAMHGGTAINLFLRNMVDIAERATSLTAINDALIRIQKNIIGLRNTMHVQHRPDVLKLQVTDREVVIKIEVNPVGRGLLGEKIMMPLCDAAQEQFDAFCVVPIVPKSQLFGGKLCAALDRQHPRDFF